MLELHLDPDVSSGYLKVSWCLDKDLLSKLQEHENYDPNLVITITDAPRAREEGQPKEEDYSYNDEPETTICVKLKDLVAYLPLHRAGQQQVVAFIDTHQKYVGGGRYDYCSLREASKFWTENYIFNAHRDGFRKRLMDGDLPQTPGMISEPAMIEVPKGIFASEIAEFEKTWLEWMLPVNFSNQCQLRKYRLFGYLIQPPIFLCYLLLARLPVLLVALLIGWRNIDASGFFSPSTDIQTYCKEIFSGNGSRFVRTTEQGGWRNYIFLPFMPAIAIPLFFFLRWIIKTILMMGLLKFSLLIVLPCLSIVAGIIGLVKLIVWMTTKAPTKPTTPWYLTEEYQQLLLCGGEPKKISFKHKPMKLFYQEFKNQICKPFSK